MASNEETALAVTEQEQRFAAPKSPDQLMELAAGRGATVAEMTALFDLQMRWKAEEARMAWIEDMARLKRDMPTILKTKHVDQGVNKANYWHAELDKAVPVLVAALNKYGFTHRWESPEPTAGWITVSCVIQHRLGHSEKTTLGGPPDATGGKNAIQAVGSTKYYLERYTLFGALGIAPKGADDDGAGGKMTNEWMAEQLSELERCETLKGLAQAFNKAGETALDGKDLDSYNILKEKAKQIKVARGWNASH